MRDNLIVEQVRQAIERRRARPAEERWDELVRRGAIDARGRVKLGKAPRSGKRKPKLAK